MKAAHAAQRPRLVCEMFAELQAAHHGHTKPATITDRDVRRIEALMAEGVTFVELKNVLAWLWFDPAGQHWRTKLDGIAGFVNAYDTLAVRVDKHLPRTATGARAAVADPVLASFHRLDPAVVQAAGETAAGWTA